MKTSAFLTACLFISSLVSAQNIEWTKRIGFEPSANYQNIVTDDLNNLHLFYSVIDVHGKPLYSILRKYDPSGNLSGTDTLSLNAVLNYVERSNHSTFYVTGFSGDSSLQIGGFFVGYGSFNAQLDFNNNWIDAHPLIPGASYLNDPVFGVADYEFDDGENLYISDTYYDPGGGPSTSELYKLDSIGNSISGVSGGGHTSGVSTLPTAQGSWYGLAHYSHSGSYYILTKISPTGNIEWSWNTLPVQKMAADAGGNFYFTGSFTGSIQLGSFNLSDTSSNGSLFIAKMDTLRNIVWANKISGSDGLGAGILKCDTVNGRLYLAGTYKDSVGFNGSWYGSHYSGPISNGMFLASYDLNGSSSWITTAASSNEVVPERMTMSQNGSIYVFGFFQDSLFVNPLLVSDTSGNQYSFIMKIADETNNVESVSSNNKIFIYPNPADKFISIILQDKNYSQVQITTIDGKIVRAFSLLHNNQQIPVNDLADGNYILTISGVGQNPISSKIIVMHSRK